MRLGSFHYLRLEFVQALHIGVEDNCQEEWGALVRVALYSFIIDGLTEHYLW